VAVNQHLMVMAEYELHILGQLPQSGHHRRSLLVGLAQSHPEQRGIYPRGGALLLAENN